MSVLARLGLRARLAIALVGVAVLAVGLATLLANRGLDPLLGDAARSRLQSSAEHMAEVATAVYADEGGWSQSARQTLTHLAELDGLLLSVQAADTARFGADLPAGADTTRARGTVDGRVVGTIEVAREEPGLLTPEEEHLQHSLDRLHLVAGAASVAAALLLAFLLAETLSRPLRRIRVTAERIDRGDLHARVEPTGDSEVRSVAHSLNRLAETLEHEEQVRKQTVGDIAHELRTPVHGLLSRIEAAQDGVLEDERANLAAMHTEALRLARLLDDLNRLADAERPGFLLAKQPVDLAAVVSAQARTFGPRFAEAELEFIIALDPTWTIGDANRLGQIVPNLLENALRYTERGGTVFVRVRPAGDTAILEVEDTGIGIAPDDQRHVFTRFWRGEKSRSRATGGAGIGLAVVRELVRAHEGRVDVESVPGRGSTFHVFLPAVKPREIDRSSSGEVHARS
ncbi:N/A [soil metagenome]